METGVLTADSLSDVLRKTSQRKRNGVLDIQLQNETLMVAFVGGRAVEVFKNQAMPALEVVERLVAAELVPEEVWQDQETWQGSYESFMRYAQQQDWGVGLDPARVKEIIQHRVLDMLYSIPVDTGAVFSFGGRLPEYDRQFCPQISLGQLLLDLVDLEEYVTRCESLFSGDRLIVRVDDESDYLSDEEGLVLQSIREGCRLNELRRRTGLSIYAFCENLLELHEVGSVAAQDLEPDIALDESVAEPVAIAGEPAVERDDHVLAESNAAEQGVQARSSGASKRKKKSRAKVGVLERVNNALLAREEALFLVSIVFLCAAAVLPVLFWSRALIPFGLE